MILGNLLLLQIYLSAVLFCVFFESEILLLIFNFIPDEGFKPRQE